jgi:hypothetical protein
VKEENRRGWILESHYYFYGASPEEPKNSYQPPPVKISDTLTSAKLRKKAF